MTALAKMKETGGSGREFTFNVYPYNTDFAAVGAVYIVSKRTKKPEGGGNHRFLYFGETSDLSDRFDDHHKGPCFAKHGANCICVHRDDKQASRRSKEADLLGNHDTPCNG